MEATLPPPVPEEPSRSIRLEPAWSRTVCIGWSGLAIALVCTGVSSHIIGRPVFWLDDQRWPTLVLGILAILVVGSALFAAFWSYGNGARIPIVSFTATVILAFSAIADTNRSPGAAVVEGALAVSALLLTAASYIGRSRRADSDT